MSDRILIRQGGRIAETGAADAIVLRPERPYARCLIGDVPTLSREWS